MMKELTKLSKPRRRRKRTRKRRRLRMPMILAMTMLTPKMTLNLNPLILLQLLGMMMLMIRRKIKRETKTQKRKRKEIRKRRIRLRMMKIRSSLVPESKITQKLDYWVAGDQENGSKQIPQPFLCLNNLRRENSQLVRSRNTVETVIDRGLLMQSLEQRRDFVRTIMTS